MRTFALTLVASFALLSGAPALAQSHDHGGHAAHGAAVQTTPSDGAAGAAPTEFSAIFEHPMRLTAFVITPRGGDPIALTIPAGSASTRHSLDLPPLGSGHYTFAWTAIGADNHTMTGRVRYIVQ